MSAVCPYCRCPLNADDVQTTCPGCDTPHHSDCFEENGGCTVFGCSHAPSDDPPVRVELEPIHSIATPAQPAAPEGVAERIAELPPLRVPPPPPLVSANTPPPPGAYPTASSGAPALSLAEVYAGVGARKSRTTFVLLGIFLGAFGVHNFYAGYYRKAAAQLCLTVFTCFYGSIVSEIWAIIEVCIVTRDGDDQDLQ